MRYFFLLLLLIFLSGWGNSQNIDLFAAIGLAEDFCSFPISDPDADCANVSTNQTSLDYLPGEDQEILITYYIRNNTGATIVKALIEDEERGEVFPVDRVNILPGATFAINRIFPPETAPRSATPRISATVEDAGGRRATLSGDYAINVLAPDVDLDAELYNAEDLCTDVSSIASCSVGTGGTTFINLPGSDIVYLEMPIENTGPTTLTNHSWSIDNGLGEVVTTSFNLAPGANIIGRYLLDPPNAPGSYNFIITYRGEDLAGNAVTRIRRITVTIPAPMADTDVELYVARDVCDDENSLISCGVESGGTNTLTIPPGRNLYIEVNIENAGLDSLTNHEAEVQGLGQITSTSFRLRPEGNITLRGVLQVPTSPGIYNYNVIYTATDLAGNPLENIVPITLTIPGPEVETSV
ncbi:MAG: hypothetical protein AAF840_16195, partial [Bacteroidota bacterium]